MTFENNKESKVIHSSTNHPMKKIEGDFVEHVDLHYLVVPICYINFKCSITFYILCMLIDVRKKHNCKFLNETRCSLVKSITFQSKVYILIFVCKFSPNVVGVS